MVGEGRRWGGMVTWGVVVVVVERRRVVIVGVGVGVVRAVEAVKGEGVASRATLALRRRKPMRMR
jgi:hypothetical protein